MLKSEVAIWRKRPIQSVIHTCVWVSGNLPGCLECEPCSGISTPEAVNQEAKNPKQESILQILQMLQILSTSAPSFLN